MSQKTHTWESQLHGCFGSSDHVFAGHSAEEKHAKDLRKLCLEQKVAWEAVEKEIRTFLKSKKVSDAKITEQLERAHTFLKLS